MRIPAPSEKLNISNRLGLLARHVRVSKDELEAQCRKLVRSAPKGRYKSESSVANLFREVRPGGVASIGAREDGLDERDVDLVADAVKILLPSVAPESLLKLRLDARLSEFLAEVECSEEELFALTSDNGRELLEFVSEFSLPKKLFFPGGALIKNSELPKAFKFPRYLTLLRYNARSGAEFPLVEEKISFNISSFPEAEYLDCFGTKYFGVPIFSHDKIVISFLSSDSSSAAMGVAVVTIFLDALIEGEYLASISRSGRSEFGCSSYRAVCVWRDEDFLPVPAIGPVDGRQVKYAFILDNVHSDGRSPQLSFEMSTVTARQKLLKGQTYLKVYIESVNHLSNLNDTRQLLDRLAAELG